MGTESLSERQRTENEGACFDQAADLALAALAAKRRKSHTPLPEASPAGAFNVTPPNANISLSDQQVAAEFDIQADTSSTQSTSSRQQSSTPSSAIDASVVYSDLTHRRGAESPTRSTMEEYRRILLGGQPQFTSQQVADQSGTSVEMVHEFWSAMGFQPVNPDDVAFTSRDVESYMAWVNLVKSGAVDLATARSLAQAQSHLADRLALWQVEALVEDASRRLDLDDTSARLVALDHMREYLDILQDTMVYSWQRQLENLLTRVDRDVSQRGHEEARRRFPLTRSLGFADMVSFTASSAIMGDKMVALVERFEDICRTAVAASGGRVVKMIGDAVFFVADDLGTGLRLVTNLLDYLQADSQILPVRASFVRGDVFSRSGDMFGPTVNLASRLVDIAPVGRILTDASTAAAIAAGKGGSGYWLENFPSAELRGFGRVSPYLLSRVQE